ncbi:hypothetical protein pb186bvf_019525 [Paramecium bursaria]
MQKRYLAKSKTPIKGSDTPRFKDIKQPIQFPQPKITQDVNMSDYFTFGQKSIPSPKAIKTTSSNKSIPKTKVQIFNNNYQIINVGDKPMLQISQIIKNSTPQKFQSPTSYFNGSRMKKTQSSTPKLQKNILKSIDLLSSAYRSKTEANLIQKRPIISNQLKENKSTSTYDSARTIQTLYGFKKPKEETLQTQLTNLKIKFVRVAQKWNKKEENYLLEQQKLRNEILRLKLIIEKLTR